MTDARKVWPPESQVICDKAEAALLSIPDDSVDAIVTDPPAGIAFMGKKWDSNKGGRDAWIAWMTGIAAECLRVLKPGGHALVWAIPRTSHWTATAWEDAGFEVRDRISHLFGSGFPKSLDVGKAIDKAAGAEREVVGPDPYASNHPNPRGAAVGQNYGTDLNPARPVTAPATDDAKEWDGWGTALKPACEDWWLLRKPLGEPTVAANVLKHGTGGINVDACRIPTDPAIDDMLRTVERKPRESQTWEDGSGFKNETNHVTGVPAKGRWPANVTHDGSEEVLAGFPGDRKSGGSLKRSASRRSEYGMAEMERDIYTDSGSAARFFYCAKAPRSDRGKDNKHPTVKNSLLMEWLIKLITPPGGVVLDCFAGSGSTLVACMRLGHRFIGIEQEAEYCATLRARLSAGPLYGEHE